MFDQIIGHEEVRQVLAKAVGNGRLAHAYLFIGPEGVGKRAVATSLLREVLATDQLAVSPDLYVLRRETDEKTEKLKTVITVDQMREAIERFSMSAMGGKKAMFIEEADHLHTAAANSLLKTLEEPRGDAILILIADHPDAVPATIVSRCQVLRFHLVKSETIETALRERGLSPKDAKRTATIAAGRPGIAVRLVSDGAYRAQIETAAATFRELVDASVPAKLKRAADLLPKDEANKAVVLEETLDAWEAAMRDELHASIEEHRPVTRWSRALKTLRDTRTSLPYHINPQLALERVLLSL